MDSGEVQIVSNPKCDTPLLESYGLKSVCGGFDNMTLGYWMSRYRKNTTEKYIFHGMGSSSCGEITGGQNAWLTDEQSQHFLIAGNPASP